MSHTPNNYLSSDRKVLACFDLDGTLTSTNSIHQLYIFKTNYYGWFQAMCWRVLFVFQIPLFFLLYKINPERFNQFLYSRYRGMKEGKLLEILESKVLPFIWRNLYSHADTLIRDFRRDEADIVIISASWSPVVDALARKIKAKVSFGTRVEVKHGTLTGRIIECVDNECKSEYLGRMLEASSYDSVHVFGNSTLDIPMLKLATQANVINPSSALREWASETGAHIHNWQHPKTHWTMVFFRIVLRKYFHEIQGWQNIPKEKGCIIIANHSSHLDQYLLYPLIGKFARRRPKYLAKKEIFDTAILGRLCKYMGAYPVDRDRGGRSAIHKAIELVNAGHMVVIFPEGTRTKTGDMSQFKAGVVLIQEKTQAPILPIGLSGTYEAWPHFEKYPKQADVSLSIGELINSFAGDLSKGETINKSERASQLQSVVSELVEQC